MDTNPFKELTKLGENDRFPFGKFKGMKIDYVLSEEPSYIVWWDENVASPQIRNDIVLAAHDLCDMDSEFGDWNNGEFYKD